MSDNKLRKRSSPTERSKAGRSQSMKEPGTQSKHKAADRSQSLKYPAGTSKAEQMELRRLIQSHTKDSDSPSKHRRQSGNDQGTPSQRRTSNQGQSGSPTRRRASNRQAAFDSPGITSYHSPPSVRRVTSATGRGNSSDSDIAAHPQQSGVSSSASQPRVTRDEWTFHELIEDGEVAAVARFLQERPNFNVNCMNLLGNTPLVVAAKRENLNMIKFLMNHPNIVIGDAILYAVRTGNKMIVTYMLDQQPVRKRSSETIALAQKKVNERESPDFSSDIDPLILACHLDNFELVDLMVRRGHEIDRPHLPICDCRERCHTRRAGQSLSFSLTRYHLYKAYASPSYILNTSSDPILDSFKLCKELKICSNNEREFKSNYIALSNQCEKLALDILAQCRTSEEVELIVHKRDPTIELGAGGNKKNNFARIKLAFDYDQKLFIANSNAQQMLRSAWLQNFRSWRTMSSVSKLGLVIFRIVCMPFFVILHWITPFNACARFNVYNSGPLYKFLNYVASYIIFLVFICLQMFLSAKHRKRGAPHTGMELIILMYITGYIWNNFKVMHHNGYRWFFSYKWHRFDVVTLTLFGMAFLFWSWAEIEVLRDGNRYLPRHMWRNHDPTLLAESLYAWATVCAFLKLLYFMQIDNNLGPLQISLGRTVREVFVFVILFMVFFLAFAVGLFMIYEPYSGQQKTEDGEVIKQIDAFNTLEEASQTLYWALYGYSPPVFADIVVSDEVRRINGSTVRVPNHHRITEMFGQAMFAIYNVIAIIILVNLLIGLLGNTFNEVKAKDDVEWKFARTQIYMRFLCKDSATIPPPFNIIPSFKAAINLFNCLRQCCNKNAKFSLKRGLYVKDKDDGDDEVAYKRLMKSLTMRYLIKRDYEKAMEPITMEDIDALRNDLEEYIYKQLHPMTPLPASYNPQSPPMVLTHLPPQSPYAQYQTPQQHMYQTPPQHMYHTPPQMPSAPQLYRGSNIGAGAVPYQSAPAGVLYSTGTPPFPAPQFSLNQMLSNQLMQQQGSGVQQQGSPGSQSSGMNRTQNHWEQTPTEEEEESVTNSQVYSHEQESLSESQ